MARRERYNPECDSASDAACPSGRAVVAEFTLSVADPHQSSARRGRGILTWAVPAAGLRVRVAIIRRHSGTDAGPRPDPGVRISGHVHRGGGRPALPALSRHATRPTGSSLGRRPGARGRRGHAGHSPAPCGRDSDQASCAARERTADARRSRPGRARVCAGHPRRSRTRAQRLARPAASHDGHQPDPGAGAQSGRQCRARAGFERGSVCSGRGAHSPRAVGVRLDHGAGCRRSGFPEVSAPPADPRAVDPSRPRAMGRGQHRDARGVAAAPGCAGGRGR